IIDEEGRPAEEGNCGFSYACRVRDVREKSSPVVVKQSVIVVGKGGDEQVHPPVVVDVADRQTHVGLLDAVAVIGDARRGADFFKSSVAFVAVRSEERRVGGE